MATFEPGVSGNLAGRPKGSPNKHTQLAKLLEPHAEALITKMLELALSGDSMALKLCIERLIPKVGQKQAIAVMPDLSALETSKIIPAVLSSLAGQELSISDLKSLMDIFGAHDSEIESENKKHEKLELGTKDPIEASKAYARFMQRK